MNFRQFAFRNVYRNKRTYAAYFLSSAFSVMIFFIYSVLAFHPGMKAGMIQEAAVTAMTTGQWIVYVFSFFFILYSVGAFLKTRQHEFGVFMIQGMSSGQLNRLVFLENMIIGIVAIISGVGAGVLSSKLALMVGSNILGTSLSFYIAPKAFELTVGSFFALFVVISFLTQFMVSKKKVILLLQGSNKPKPEPKANVFLALLAAVLLGGGYTLAATANAMSVALLLVPVVIMTIVGTYFLFTQLSVFIINMLKKNRSFFWRRTNLITLSDLAYRMKDNARMFFMVCIVSTVAFCAIGTLSSFGVYFKQMDYDFPFTITYSSSPDYALADSQIEDLEQQLKDHNVEYTKSNFELLHLLYGEHEYDADVISNQTYNKLAQVLGYPGLNVTGTDAKMLVNPIQMSYMNLDEPTTYAFKGTDISVTSNGIVEGLVAPYSVMRNGIVVSDDVYQQLIAAGQKSVVSGYKVQDWKDAVGIGDNISKLYEEGMNQYYNGEQPKPTFSYASHSENLNLVRQMFSIMMLAALLVGAVFFIAAGSFLYFRLYTDLEQDKAHYQAIGKLGLKDSELSRIATSQLLLLFFIPIVVAIIHSVFAFKALQSMITLSIAGETFKVLAAFTVAQIIYFLLIRWRYMNHLREAMK